MRITTILISVVGIALLSGCASYIPPSGRADLAALSNPSMQESFAAKPAAAFPASIATVRVQAPRYQSYYTQREGGVYGQGRYSVITVKEVEEDADIERIAKLPQIGGLITISTLLLPSSLQSDRELREAAARLKADMVLLYTFDTSFHDNDASVALSVVTLGLSPRDECSSASQPRPYSSTHGLVSSTRHLKQTRSGRSRPTLGNRERPPTGHGGMPRRRLSSRWWANLRRTGHRLLNGRKRVLEVR
jgi:hypothetical protein